MKLAVLFSGGKDSCAAIALAQQYGHEVVLLSMQSKNKDSYMFHTPNINLVEVQAEAQGLPLLIQETKGEKEEELEDLKALIHQAVQEHNIEGVVTGAVASVYQATRVQNICHELGLWCFNPLWQRDPYKHIEQLVKDGFEIYISAIAAYPMDESWLGKRVDKQTLQELKQLQEQHKVNPSGEGGEFETFVTHGPGWKKKIVITESDIHYDKHAGVFHIQEIELEDDEKALNKKKNIHSGVGQEVLVVSACAEPLSELEFVLPIANIVGDCAVKHYTEEYDPNDYEKIIICGTAIKDDEFSKHLDKFEWIQSYDKPVLGICAGYQILGLLAGKKLQEQVEIGMLATEIDQAYFLHHNGLGEEPIIHYGNKKGILFHPEVRNEDIVREFLKN